MPRFVPKRLNADVRYVYGTIRLAIGDIPRGSRKIFVLGSGRSGTHWVGNTLASHPAIRVLAEEPPVFKWVTEMAREPEREKLLFPKLIERYKSYHAGVAPFHLADKSHPNIWLAERLAATFPDARFVGVRRNLLPTVASMLVHKGVRRWHEIWDQNPRADRLLGVTPDMIGTYKAMPLEARCAVRVIAHSRKLDRLRQVLGEAIHIIQYEELHASPDAGAAQLASFLELPGTLTPPAPDSSSVVKWKSQLTSEQKRSIIAVANDMGATDLIGVDG